jgi:hypothetical protein
MGKVLTPPEGLNKNSKLWRYMSIPKLVSLLSKKQLYFCRVDKLEDQREAMLSPRTVDREVEALLNDATILKILGDRTDGDTIARLTAGSSDMLLRASTFVNCWYHSEAESVSMWKVYGDSGIAIQSTWKRLTQALPEGIDVLVDAVKYVDYSTMDIDPRLPFLYKDKIYGNENEIRALVKDPPREYSILSVVRDHPPGKYVDVDLDRLIKRVYLAPGTSSWLKDIVKELMKKYGLGTKEVENSIADEQPEYRQLYIEERHLLIEGAFPLHPYIFEDGERENPWGVILPQESSE